MCVVEDGLEVLLVADQKAKVVVLLLEAFELCEGADDSELLLELATAVLEGLVVQKNDVGVGVLLAGLLSHLDVHFTDEGDVKQFDLVLGDYAFDLLFSSLGH